MDCREAEKIIPLYLDGEFSGSDTKELEEHINRCSRCKIILKEEEELKKAVASLKMKRAPVSLRNKIESRLDFVDRKTAVFSFFKTSFVVTSTALAVVSTFMLINVYKSKNINKNNIPSTLSAQNTNPKFHLSRSVEFSEIPEMNFEDEIIPATYTPAVTFASYDNVRTNNKPNNYTKTGIPLGIMENLLVKHYSLGRFFKKRRNIRQLNRWIKKNLRKINSLPVFDDLNAKFAGAVRTTFNNQNAVQIKYFVNDKPVTVLLFTPKSNSSFTQINNTKDLQKLSSSRYINKTPGGRMVAVFIHHNLGFSIVSELGKDKIQKMIKDIITSY